MGVRSEAGGGDVWRDFAGSDSLFSRGAREKAGSGLSRALNPRHCAGQAAQNEDLDVRARPICEIDRAINAKDVCQACLPAGGHSMLCPYRGTKNARTKVAD